MNYLLFTATQSSEVIGLFKSVFSETEGEAEGQVIADFVSNLITTTKREDLIGCIAENNGSIVGCIFFSRLTVPSDDVAFILSPVAVLTEVQGQGIGKTLIEYGLEHLKAQNVSLAFTYGDPAYYAKFGFKHMDENIVKAPCPLSQPIGWLAQSLDGHSIQAMKGATQCVDALNDPSLW
ncbi:GNAT family N-acetyltransferase [Marinomonas algicola]|uniref:GNAT family N-acetyltransferase n=1 Tax=Marinomonas algicola TaxID=2773454 RepID=UPI00174D000D|nr:N-acetyltransferase [Marinomonas algicola]